MYVSLLCTDKNRPLQRKVRQAPTPQDMEDQQLPRRTDPAERTAAAPATIEKDTTQPATAKPLQAQDLPDPTPFTTPQQICTFPPTTSSSPQTASTASTPPAASHLRPPSPQILTAKILTMMLENGTALGQKRPRPYVLAQLNTLRTQLLLNSPFFDPAYRPEELQPRTLRAKIPYVEMVVLMARLIRVMVKGGRREGNLGKGILAEGEGEGMAARELKMAEDNEDERERVTVRNLCLGQAFFQKGEAGSARPFSSREEFNDEGCDV